MDDTELLSSQEVQPLSHHGGEERREMDKDCHQKVIRRRVEVPSHDGDALSLLHLLACRREDGHMGKDTVLVRASEASLLALLQVIELIDQRADTTYRS